MADSTEQWRAPASGTPLKPGEVASPSASEIASLVAAKLAVPRGPVRTVALVLGPATGLLNSSIARPILAAPGLIRAIDFQAQIVATGATAGLLQLFDGDSNSPLIRSFVISVGAAGTFSEAYAAAPLVVPFLNGITALWTPFVAAFGICQIAVNIDFESIPIGQRLEAAS